MVESHRQTLQLSSYCFDCNEPEPTFASLNHGITLCAECAQCHEACNTQKLFLSDIKPLPTTAEGGTTQDEFSDRDYEKMSIGGNAQLNSVFHKYALLGFGVCKRYRSRAVEQYRRRLEAEVNRCKFVERELSF